MARAIYAGSFDPITNGHVWVIKQALRMFDKVFVAVGVNPDKKSSFSLEDRIKMIRAAFPNEDKIEVIFFQKEFLVNLCSQNSIDVMIRGIRNVQDFEYEQQILYINDKINPSIQTVYIIPPSEYAGLSSSMVKGLLGFSEWQFIAKDLIPDGNLKYLMNLAFSNKELDRFLINNSSFRRDEILAAYNANGRFYHTIQHVNEMLREEEIRGGQLISSNPLAWAIIFHDYVYNAASGNNEEDSVIEWEKFYDELKPIVNKQKVSDLIMATKSHQVDDGDVDKMTMIDMDFAILGSDVNRFNEYERQIRFEYAFVGDAVYKQGRMDFIKSVLARNTIFLTQYFQDKYEAKARLNLNKLYQALENSHA